ncbi:MAG TPA: NlpC/P60 family protein [Candidatus Binataceae bacterium]|nr:NlpC/P60 family protein [Candidatus Binataceae bacterium]
MKARRSRPITLKIPARFLSVPYDGSRYPGAIKASDLRDGANCQRFAFELLRHFGRTVPNFRSSELWDDAEQTTIAKRLRPLDLLLFSRDGRAWGAHVGVYLGEGQVIHLAKKVGRPEIWTMADFAADPSYRVFIGAKRVRASSRVRAR